MTEGEYNTGRVCPVCHTFIVCKANPGECTWEMCRFMVTCEKQCGGAPMPYSISTSLLVGMYRSFDHIGADYIDLIQKTMIQRYLPHVWDTLWDDERKQWRTLIDICREEAFEIAMKRKKEEEE